MLVLTAGGFVSLVIVIVIVIVTVVIAMYTRHDLSRVPIKKLTLR